MEMENCKKRDKPLIGIIANSTSSANRLDLIAELGLPNEGFFNPLKFSFREFTGEIIPLDIQPNEVLEKSGMIKAKKAMLGAVKYLAERGVKIICFTASTKRLPGRNGQEVKKLYPEMIFSIGDNATTISYLSLIDFYLNQPGKINPNDNVVCLGAGFLGLESINRLLKNGHSKNITLVSEQKLNGLGEQINIINSLAKLPNDIKMFMSCSHKYELCPQSFKNHLHAEAIILDVAVPPGISREVYESLPKSVSRFDAGDFFLKKVDYKFPAKILTFPAVGFWFGCFTEAIMLGIAIENGENLKNFNFFEINREAQELLIRYLRNEEISIPLINFYKQGAIQFIPF